MDKLKYIKLENEDGSYSDSIPLSVSADYVDIPSTSETSNLTNYIANNNIDINNLKSTASNLQNKVNDNTNAIQGLASGSPKGSYATVTALINANPDTGVYIVQEDGHIYSWTKNGSSAIDLGAYESSFAIEDLKANALNFKQMNWNNFPQYQGYLEDVHFEIEQGTISRNDGSIAPSSERYRTTDFIESEDPIFIKSLDEKYWFKPWAYSKEDDSYQWQGYGPGSVKWYGERDNYEVELSSEYKYRLAFCLPNYETPTDGFDDCKKHIFIGTKSYDEFLEEKNNNSKIIKGTKAQAYINNNNTLIYYWNGTYKIQMNATASQDPAFILYIGTERVSEKWSDIMTLAENAGLTVDYDNKIINIDTHTVCFYYDLDDEAFHWITNSSFINKNNAIVLYAQAYYSHIYGLIVEQNEKLLNWKNRNTVNTLSNTVTNINTRLTALENENDNFYAVPEYYEDHLVEKVTEIRENMASAGQHGETFIFITDLHWESNEKHSPALMKYILDNTNINTIIGGGDVFSYKSTADEGVKICLECINKFKFKNTFFPMAFGNHDNNTNGSTPETLPIRRMSHDAVYSAILKQNGDHVNYFSTTECSFWWDVKETKTRFVVIDTQNAGGFSLYNKLVEVISDVENGWNIILIGHLFNHQGWKPLATNIRNIMKAYNDRTISEAVSGITYDFTNVEGTFVGVIGGHVHKDMDWVEEDNSIPPIILNDCDAGRLSSNENYPYVINTITEQSFTVFTVDYQERTIKAVRIGRGADREYTY